MFEKTPHKSKRKEFVHDHFDQYYKGIKVDGAEYNLHYKNGQMYFANGNFVKVGNINASPSISLDEAITTFLTYKSIENGKVSNTITELLIKEIADTNSKNNLGDAALVYRIYLEADHKNNDEVGYVNAHTGKVVMTEPRLIHTTGTFATRYSGTRQAETDPITGGHRLLDDTRGAIIHTRNLQNNTTVYSSAVELLDNDNNWRTSEHGANNNDMGLDVHWGLQEIYTHLNNAHGINSFDDAGVTINAYVRYGANTDNAFWDPTANVLLFGQGSTLFSPVASLDVVAHEFGHGITDFQIGWGNNERAFNEGLSDIWGAILEQRILSNATWHIGEQITLTASYLRNIQNTNDTNAESQIADTFQSTQYNNSTNAYVRSGVFSHWFYILVEGESGINDVGDSYDVKGIGLDLAEELIVEAVFENYLDNLTTYPDIRDAFITAATEIFCENSLALKSVTDAWYAVGVGSSSQIQSIGNIVGSNKVCTGNTEGYMVNNLPNDTNVAWSVYPSSGFTLAQNGNSISLSSTGSYIGEATLKATVTNSCGSLVGETEKKIQTGAQRPVIRDKNGNEIASFNFPTITWESITFSIPSGTLEWDWEKVSGNFTLMANNTNYAQVFAIQPTFGIIEVRLRDGCGWSAPTLLVVNFTNGSGGGFRYTVFPNPASDVLTVGDSKAITASGINSVNAFGEQFDSRTATSSATLYNFNGKPVKSISPAKGSINLIGVLPGHYILIISHGDTSESHHVIIE